MALLTVEDLTPFGVTTPVDQLAEMIADVEALAGQVAPCLTGTLPETQAAAARAVLRGAVLRWVGQLGADDRQMMAGPFSIGPVSGNERRPLLWPSEITQLQGVCSAVTAGAGGKFGQIRLQTPAWWVR